MSTQRKFKNLSGEEVAITYRPLVRREAMEVEHTALGVVVKALVEASEPMFELAEKFKGLAPEEENPEAEGVADNTVEHARLVSKVAEAISRLHKVLPFDMLWALGEKIFAGAVIEGPEKLAKVVDLNECDYFTDRYEEYMLGLFWGLDVSYPRVFGKARKALAVFGAVLPGVIGSMAKSGALPRSS